MARERGDRVIGMVLAAGAGRRLRPDTDHMPKALLPVAGDRTILDLALRNMAEAGLTDVVVVVGYAADQVKARQRGLEADHGVTLALVENPKAELWNNAYSLWLARDHFREGVLLVNGDTVHPASVEQTLLREGTRPVTLAVDTVKRLADEEMKVVFRPDGTLRTITKNMDPGAADGEYIGATLIRPDAAAPLAECLQVAWEKDPHLYYEDGYQIMTDRHPGSVGGAAIGDVPWVEVDNHDDLRRARQIAPRCYSP